jgi:predicted TIM-barrel fold metal-dependent hydrolase
VVTQRAGDEAAQEAGAGTDLLIDTDVHECPRSANDLKPYLDEHWASRLASVFMPPAHGVYPAAHKTRVEWRYDGGPAGSDLDLLRRHLFEEEKVSIAILNGFLHATALPGNYEYATALARAYNDWEIAEWLDKDDRLRGSVHVAAQDPASAAEEIDRVAAHPQIVQVFLTTMTDRQFGDPFYHPIYEAAVRNGLVVTFHHGGATQTVLGYPRYWIEWHTVAAPQAAQNQLLSLICNGVFDKFPELMVMLLETGVAWVPWFMWRLDQQYREARFEVPWVKRLPSEHMRDNVRISTQPMGDVTARQFVQLVEMVQSEQMFMFSTDYPHYDADSANAVLPGTIPNDLRERIRFRNALETFPRINIAA